MFWLRSGAAWDEVDYLALDLETTAVDPRRAAALSIGTVPIRGGTVRWGERWYRLARPASVEQAATDAVVVHQLLPDRLTAEPAFVDLVPEIAARLAGATLVVHWGRLDLALLRRAFSDAGVPWPRPPVVDTVHLLAKLDRRRHLLEPAPRPTPTQLGEARRALGLPPHQEHHALYDALATAELLLALRARLGVRRARQLR